MRQVGFPEPVSNSDMWNYYEKVIFPNGEAGKYMMKDLLEGTGPYQGIMIVVESVGKMRDMMGFLKGMGVCPLSVKPRSLYPLPNPQDVPEIFRITLPKNLLEGYLEK